MGIGDRIGWVTVNGPASGVIEDEHPCGWLVRLDNGKSVVVFDREVVERNRRGEAGAESVDTSEASPAR